MLLSTSSDCDHLKELREAIIAEAGKRVDFSSEEIADALIDEHRDVVIKAFRALIQDAMERLNDDHRTQRIFDKVGQDNPLLQLIRMTSEMLGVPQSHLLRINGKRFQRCCKAVELIQDLRLEAIRADIDAMKALEDRIRPVIDEVVGNGQREPTAGEALEILQQRTDETLRRIEEDATS